jgi:hypothetical protein
MSCHLRFAAGCRASARLPPKPPCMARTVPVHSTKSGSMRTSPCSGLKAADVTHIAATRSRGALRQPEAIRRAEPQWHDTCAEGNVTDDTAEKTTDQARRPVTPSRARSKEDRRRVTGNESQTAEGQQEQPRP